MEKWSILIQRSARGEMINTNPEIGTWRNGRHSFRDLLVETEPEIGMWRPSHKRLAVRIIVTWIFSFTPATPTGKYGIT